MSWSYTGCIGTRGDQNMDNRSELVEYTADIVAAYVGNNSVPVTELPSLINDVIRALNGAMASGGEVVLEEARPAVPIKKSVTPDYIICLEDGKKFKSLKRHLRTHYDLTPERYREKWGLPPDYPMVAPNYAVARSKLARQMGLGQRPRGKSQLKEPSSPRFQALCVAHDLAVAAPSIHKLRDCSACRFAKGGRPPWRGICRKGHSGLSS